MKTDLKTIAKALETLSDKELKNHILAYAEKDENFLDNFTKMVSSEEIGKPYKDYLQKIKKCFTDRKSVV